MEPFMTSLAILAIGLGLYHFLFRPISFFKDIGMPHVPGIPIFGNMASYAFRRKPPHIILQELYNKFSNLRYFGFYDFTNPVIVVRDPEIMHTISIKHFNNFCDHKALVNDHEPLLAKNLFQLKGDQWRETRKILSPSFTSSKMKTMFGLIEKCAVNLVGHIVANTENQRTKEWTVEMKDILVKYTNDAVATTAYGIDIDSMKNPNNDFITMAKAANLDSILSLKISLGKSFPGFFKAFNIKLFDEKVSEFFRKVIVDNVTTREREGIVRPDMVQMMMESKEKMSYEDMTSQAFVFFLAGADSTASFMCFVLHELAVNPDIQRKLREEVDQSLKATDGQPTYTVIMNMKYLDAVINETLRLYPLSLFIDRYCVETYELPPITPGGKSFTVNPGMNVWYLPHAAHRDPKYFPDPDKFNPDRFLEGNVDSMAYMPFGLGPRICIGNRYALMLSKVVIFYLLSRCELERCPKTLVPMRFSKKSFIMSAEKGFWITIKQRKSACPSKDTLTNG